ncbi:MAG: methylated-DNA--[protein]-cysteine S-methyltransferase [Spirochaetota bacterium]
MKVSTHSYKTKFGVLLLGSWGEKLCLCDWQFRKKRAVIDKRIQQGLQTDYNNDKSATIVTAIQQVEEYFAGERKSFSLPLHLVGTPFQKAVWQALQEIPWGQTETYAGLSERMQNPKAIRAIATANGANALSLFVPCHRIIGANGDMVGYAGGVAVKRKLLEAEGVDFHKGQGLLFT